MKTIRELAKAFPKMYNYHYKWRHTGDAHLERNLNEVLADYNYKLAPEDEGFLGEYNDLRGYLNCKIVKL